MGERDGAALRQMRDYAFKAIEWTTPAGMSWTGDEKTVAAVVLIVGQIAEAARGISEAFRREHPEVAWREIAVMRNVLYHDFAQVDLDVLASTVAQDLPLLLEQLERILGVGSRE